MDLASTSTEANSLHTNVADRLSLVAKERPDGLAVVAAQGNSFAEITYAQLDQEATHLAQGLIQLGVEPSTRIALLVKPSIEFVALVFAILRSGATMVLVDSGLGRKNLVECLSSTEPRGFVGIPIAHAMRVLKRRKFPDAKINVTVGRRWFWGGETLLSLRELGKQNPVQLPLTRADDPAAIVFTSGSTGPPKGVLYCHETFVTQCTEIQTQYGLQPGAVDLACFPLFGLFNVACGITTVFPKMDFSRPASCDPSKLVATANRWKCSQAFASPAVWDKLSRHCESTSDQIPTLSKVFSCGAPVPARVLRRTLACVHPEAEMHTPYGATEALPVATIEAQEILTETVAKTDTGAGVCVGRRFNTIDWRVIQITDSPIPTIEETKELAQGEIGELIVRAPQVSQKYLDQISQKLKKSEPEASASESVASTGEPEASAPGANHNQKAKIQDQQTIWHRMGDIGYFDPEGRFWYCGRKSQRVDLKQKTIFTIPVEAVVNCIEGVRRSALVGYRKGTDLSAAIVYEKETTVSQAESADLRLRVQRVVDQNSEQWFVDRILEHPGLPTDIRHNSKINREVLAQWVEKEAQR